MTEYVSFGYLLRRLLVERNWSAAQLAREINLDSSYVRRWIREDRVPSLKTNHVERIAYSLCSSMYSDNDRLEKIFIETLEEMNFKIDTNNSCVEIIASALSKAQMYSLKVSSSKKKLKSLSKYNDFSYTNIASNYIFHKTSEIPSILKGKKTIIYTIIELMKKAMSSELKEDKRFLITSLGEEYIFNSFSGLNEEWNFIIKDALKAGWNINHLWRLNNNYNRSTELVKNLINFLGYEGMYTLNYFQKYETLIPPYEIIIISNIGALICFSCESFDSIDTAFFFSDKEKINSLTKNYYQLKAQSQLLIKAININEYFNLTTKKDRKPDNSLVYSSSLDTLTFPYHLWVKYLKETYRDDERKILEHTKRIKSRIEDFNEQVLKYKFKFIFSFDTIDHLIKTGRYYQDTKYKNPTPEDIVIHLSHIIYLLEKYDNLEIAFIDEKTVSDFPNTYFEIKGNKTVIMSMNRKLQIRGSEKNLKYATSNEEILVTAFTNYFMNAWNKITPKFKNKKYIIEWLKEQIEWFSNKHIEANEELICTSLNSE